MPEIIDNDTLRLDEDGYLVGRGRRPNSEEVQNMVVERSGTYDLIALLWRVAQQFADDYLGTRCADFDTPRCVLHHVNGYPDCAACVVCGNM